MLTDGVSLISPAVIEDLQIQYGTAFPGSNNNIGELFFRTDEGKLYAYSGSVWIAVGGASSVSAGDLTGTALPSNVVSSSLTSVGNVSSGTWSGSFGAVSGANLTSLTAANLTGTTLPSSIVNSSLTSVGTLSTLSVTGAISAGQPTLDSHVATKLYVDNLVQGMSWKAPVRATTDTNITLSSVFALDGISLQVGDRVLVKNQNTSTQNGVYVVSAGVWSRASDMDGSPSVSDVNGAVLLVTDGSLYADTVWVQTSTITTVGSQAMTFVQMSGSAVNAGSLIGTTLASNVVNSSLTSIAAGATIGGIEIGYQVLPRTISFNAAARGKRVAITSGVTIPANTYVGGDAFSFYNDSASPVTITQGSGLTLRQDGTVNTGDRTLAAYGSCFVWFNTATEAIINGSLT